MASSTCTFTVGKHTDVDLLDSKGNGYQVGLNNCLKTYFLEKRKKVLFVGEGDFSFTVAFAALRKLFAYEMDLPPSTWQGIIATTKEDQVPNFDKVKLDCILNSTDWCEGEWRKSEGIWRKKSYIQPSPAFLKLENGLHEIYMCDSDQETLKTRVLADLPCPEDNCWRIQYDALKPFTETNSDVMSSELPFDGVWFQCPWLEYPGNIGELVEQFLLNASKYTSEGEYVCVGITNHSYYVRRYCLEKVLGEGLQGWPGSTEVLQYYKFLGADNDLIYRILSFGYHHRSVMKDIHDFILEHHLTLVFQRKTMQM